MKTAADTGRSWVEIAPAVFWAERVAIQRATGRSAFEIAHGVELLLPFDILEATFMAPQEGKEDNTVFFVQQSGFKLNGRVLRAAKVGVVKNK